MNSGDRFYKTSNIGHPHQSLVKENGSFMRVVLEGTLATAVNADWTCMDPNMS